MTLQQIDDRLSLFDDYLAYRIDAKFTQPGFTYTPEYIIRMFENRGFLIQYHQDIGVPLLSFDQWLLLSNYDDLAIDPEIITIGTTPMMQKVKYGGQTIPYQVLGSYDMFKQMDEMLKDYYN